MFRIQKLLMVPVAFAIVFASVGHARDKKPNIVMIMGDDIGWFNIAVKEQIQQAIQSHHGG